MTSPKHEGLLVETIVNGPFGENCFLVMEPSSCKAIVVDPGDEAEHIVERVRASKAEVIEIVATHAHIDHVGAVAPLKRLLGVPFALHGAEREWLHHLPTQAAMFGLPPKEIPEVDRELEDGQTGALGDVSWEVRHTPGHSTGSCCLYFASAAVVLAGDTLFAGSVGRTDLPGGSTSALTRSIREKLLSLDDDVTVYAGHGPPTTIGHERRHNPFLAGC